MQNLISFLIGAFIATLITTLIFLKKQTSEKEELICLRAESKNYNSLTELIKQDFVRLANESIKQEQEDLRKQNREALEEKILPLKNELGEFKAKVEKLNLTGVENTTKIVEQILNLEKNSATIAQEAKNLTEALTKNQNVKGAYGENLLDTVLQACGMREGIHYTKQFVTTSENLCDETEHKIRPDVVINLPANRHIVVDSKVTLTSYLACVEDKDKIKDFKAEVKKRIADLANKNYQSADKLWQPDFVLMFMPIETSLQILYQDFDLINFAYKSNVIIVGTASLLATIRLVNQLFTQQKQCECVNHIVNAGTNLFETFVQFCDDLVDVQKRFDEVNKKLNKTINRFKRRNNNKPSLFSQVESLRDYGINSAKEIPVNLLECELEEDTQNDKNSCS